MSNTILFKQFSSITLIGANIIPLIGALLFGWNAILILALFWIENLIIGFFNILKLLTIAAYRKQPKVLFLTAFFIFHYGMFCSVHGTLLWDILGLEKLDPALYFNIEWVGVTELFAEGATVLFAFIDKFKPEIWFGIGSLAISHLVNFVENFVLRGEVFETEAKDLMAKPYAQIFILHGGLILGAAAIEKFGSPIWLLMVIIGFKIAVEILMHQRKLKKQKRREKLKAL